MLINTVAIIAPSTLRSLKGPHRKRRESHRWKTLTFKGLCPMTAIYTVTIDETCSRPLRTTWIISPDVIIVYRYSLRAGGIKKKKGKKKYYTVRYEAILIGDARRVASIEVFSKGRLSIQCSAHASSSPAAGALCITGQRRRRLTAESRIVVNIEISRVGFDSQLDGENEEKKGVSRSRVNKKETTKRATRFCVCSWRCIKVQNASWQIRCLVVSR